MCRYATKNYKKPYACFECQVSFKLSEWHEHPVCPNCSCPMYDMGREFKAPRRGDNRGWKAVRRAWEDNDRKPPFDSCGCPPPKRYPQVVSPGMVVWR